MILTPKNIVQGVAAITLLLAPASFAQTKPASRPEAQPDAESAITVRETLAEAFGRAQAITDLPQKSSALAKLVEVQIKANDAAGALQTAAAIPDSDVRARTYAQIAFAQSRAGDDKGADATVGLAATGEATGLKVPISPRQRQAYRDGVLKAIAAAQALRGDVAGVRRSAAAATSSGDVADEFLRFLGKAQARAGDLAAAEKSFQDYFRSMPDSGASTDTGSLALSVMASTQVEFGDLPSAHATAAKIRNGATQATVFAEIARAQFEHGDKAAAAKSVSQALARAEAYKDLYGYDKSRALLDVAKAQAAIGDFQGATDTAGHISDGFSKTQALASVAVAQAQTGDAAAATATANSIVNDLSAKSREDALEEVVVALAQFGNLSAARETAAQLPKGYDQSDATSAIAVAQARAADYRGALATADQLASTDRRAWAFKIFAMRGIAEAQSEAGNAAGARLWIASLNAPAPETSALLGVAEGLLARQTAAAK